MLKEKRGMVAHVMEREGSCILTYAGMGDENFV